MDYKKHLEALRSKLANKNISVMVGSGFSKNASRKFPTWNELLQDLVHEQYRSEINDKFFETARLLKGKRLDKGSFVRNSCNEIIRQRGYLDVVSDFLRTNHTESIATYIEARTPYIRTDQEKRLWMAIGNQEEEVKDECLGLHRAIVSLPWNNIYTTNYDQLLELCIDEDEYGRLLLEIKTLTKEIEALDRRLDEITKENEVLDQQEAAESTDILRASDSDEIPRPDGSTAKSVLISDRRTALREERSRIFSSKELKRSLIKLKENAIPNCYNVVTEATSLKLKRNNNIIKLHGSLRSPEQKEKHIFEFDGDNKKQYVISREDYETYPQKHEAFTQLMRISLLQESFCLIGFSGDDPNFHAWIGWVRDILKRTKETQTDKSYKIYLIDVNTEETPADRLLFYENYNIIRIPVTSEEVIKIMVNDLHSKSNSAYGIREALDLFLNYIGNHDEIKPVVSSVDLSNETEWKDIWKNIRLPEKFWVKHSSVQERVDRLDRIRHKISVPDFRETYGQQNLINTFYYDNRRHPNKEINEDLANLLTYALQDYYLPISQAMEPTGIAKLRTQEAVISKIDDLVGLDHAMSLEKESTNATGFHKLLRLAYSFSFDELELFLETWEPDVSEVNIKAGFLSLFDANKAKVLLEDQLKSHNKFSAEQRLHLIEHLRFLTLATDYSSSSKLTRLRQAYEQAGFNPLYKNFEYLLEEIEKDRDRPEPRGAGRYSVARGKNNSSMRNQEHALKYLMLLSHSGFQFRVRSTVWLSEKKWYKISRLGFEAYPHAFLFYGLQFSDANYLKRLGEEYAFSNVLETEVLNTIAKNLLQAIPNAPETYNNHIELFLSRMLKGVSPKIWEEPFMSLWRKSVNDGSAFAETHLNQMSELCHFAFQYLEKEANIREVLEDVFRDTVEGKGENGINYTYYLDRNVHYKRLANDYANEAYIDKLIDSLGFDKLDHLYLLNNTRRLLKPSQIVNIGEKIKTFDFAQIMDSRAWRYLYLYAKDDAKTVDSIKSAILTNRRLWDTGRVDVKSWTSSDPIQISQFSAEREKSDEGIIWTQEEISSLFEAMHKSLIEFHGEHRTRDNFFNFNVLIQEIHWFLKRFEPELSELPGFEECRTLSSQIYSDTVNYDSIEDGLLSAESADVVWALSALGEMYNNGEYHFNLLQLVVNKCVMQAEPALEASISYVAAWLNRSTELLTYIGMKEAVISILRKYWLNPLVDGDVAFVEEKLVLIAYGIQPFDPENEAINWWLESAKTSRFNNVRQLVYRRSVKKKDEAG
ncbi:SIR2 family protein [Pedobacter sp. GR22-6]|uniref:SIR2 family protein n=1 Tax=Pedobacter sp. GR22-6 TaxID=3127957 RepID=UPI00307D66B5